MKKHTGSSDNPLNPRTQISANDGWSGVNATFQDVMAAQGVQEWWQLRHAWFSSEFAAFVSDSMREPDSVVVEAYAQRPDDS